MPSKLPVGPPGLDKRQVWSNQGNWPKGPGFHEESSPRLVPVVFRACAQRFAEQVAAGERPVYVKAVAREATKRVLRLHLFEQPNRELLLGYQHAQQGVSFRDREAHVAHVRRELAWEREKWSVQRSTFQWRRYTYDPNFLCWLQSVPAVDLLRWANAYLPAEQRKLRLVRQGLAQLAPMPQEIRKAHFFTTATERQLLTMAGAEVDLGVTTEHHVALVCQRLLAFHTIKNARHGPRHIAHLAEMLERHLTLRRQDFWAAEEVLGVVNKAVVRTQGRLAKTEVDATMTRVHAALQRGRAVLERRSALLPELDALRPTRLELQDACATCGGRRAVTSDEAMLPPFHPLCRCFRLAWRRDDLPELERKVTLWSLECALRWDRLPLFPFDEFIEACEQLRQGSRPTFGPVAPPEVTSGPEAWPYPRANPRLRARMARPAPLAGEVVDPLLGVSAVAARLGVGLRYVRDLCDEGKLGEVVLTEGGHRRVFLSAVEAYIRTRTRRTDEVPAQA